MENIEIKGTKIKYKNTIIRIPTILFSILMVGTLAVYFLVNVNFGSTLDVANFILLGTMEVATFYLYYPDGQLKGQNSERYINNKSVYNAKASKVNAKRQVKNLQAYCVVEYKERIKEHIETELGYCDLDYNDYLYLKSHISESELKKAKELEIEGRMVYLDKNKKARLTRLLFRKMPVSANNSRTILSAVETNSQSAIRDKSKKDKALSQFRMVLKVASIAFFSGYMLITSRDGITLTMIAQLVLDLFAIFLVAITSYIQGENNQKQYKANFYMDLSIFLDNFYEWLLSDKNIDIDTYIPHTRQVVGGGSNEREVAKVE